VRERGYSWLPLDGPGALVRWQDRSEEGDEMDVLSRDDIELLVQSARSPCVSLYIPTHRSGSETRQDPIRLKNLIHQAEVRLGEVGVRRQDASEILHPARELIEDEAFWRHQGEGLALFLRAGWFRCYRLPLSFDELVVVSDRFHVSVLLPLLTGDGRFFVLALSENEARLLAGTRSAVQVVNVPGLPAGVADALRYDDPQRELGSHAAERGGPGARVVVHGQGIGAEVQKERLGRYLRVVDGAVRRSLRGQQAPLVLAGVAYVRAMYRDINTYPHLLEAGIPGSPDRTSTEDLHARAWALVEPLFARERDDAAATYREALGTGRASDDLEEVLTAADTGRIDVLFVPTGAHVSSATYRSADVSRADGEQELGGRDRIEQAVVRTMLDGGTVYAVPEDEMPGRASVAALFRY
jgi:Bacterial archaeo-eukaryotic release factor family 3